MQRMRFLPIIIYVFVFGAAIFGASVAQTLHEPSTFTLGGLVVSVSMCLTARFLLRPFFRQAQAAQKSYAADVIESPIRQAEQEAAANADEKSEGKA